MNDAERDRLAQMAYEAEIVDPTPWRDLPEWQRESWRCEVDPDRDPMLITMAAWKENL